MLNPLVTCPGLGNEDPHGRAERFAQRPGVYE